jgi:hypothetical protein
MAMRKYIFFVFIMMNAMHIGTISSCPCGFSPDDKRPFFEQYEIEITTVTQEKKEERS